MLPNVVLNGKRQLIQALLDQVLDVARKLCDDSQDINRRRATLIDVPFLAGREDGMGYPQSADPSYMAVAVPRQPSASRC